MLPHCDEDAWQRLPLRVQRALDNLEIPECKCRPALVSSCLIGERPACEVRRIYGVCECEFVGVPSCELAYPGGCIARRANDKCSHKIKPVPWCMLPGCPKRKEGHVCECPRSPGEPCLHIVRATILLIAYARQLNGLKPSDRIDGVNLIKRWAERLQEVCPAEYYRKVPPPADLSNKETRVAVLESRCLNGFELYNSRDIVHIDGSTFYRNVLSFAGHLRQNRKETLCNGHS